MNKLRIYSAPLYIRVIFFLFILLIIPPRRVLACSCLSLNECAAIDRYETIFVGKVIHATDRSSELAKFVQEAKLGIVPSSTDFFVTGRYTFSVEEVLKGEISKKEVLIESGMGGGDCGRSFEMNKRYLLFANRGPWNNRMNQQSTPIATDLFNVSMCSPTKEVENSPFILSYLRTPLDKRVTKTWFNVHSYYDISSDQPVSSFNTTLGIQSYVLTNSNQEKFTLTTDEKGHALTNELSPGDYSVSLPDSTSLSLSEIYSSYQDERYAIRNLDKLNTMVNLSLGKCTELTLRLKPKASLSGKLITQEGKP